MKTYQILSHKKSLLLTGFEYYEKEIAEGYAYAAQTPEQALNLLESLNDKIGSTNVPLTDELYKKVGLI